MSSCAAGFSSSVFFFFKQKTAYEIPLCDWSSDVCSSDLDLALEDEVPQRDQRSVAGVQVLHYTVAVDFSGHPERRVVDLLRRVRRLPRLQRRGAGVLERRPRRHLDVLRGIAAK